MITYGVVLVNRIIFQVRFSWNACFVCFLLRREPYVFNLHIVSVVTFVTSVVYLYMHDLLFTCISCFHIPLRGCVSDGKFLSYSHR